jgi:hypothetical protein
MNKQTVQVNGAVSLALRVYEPQGTARASDVIGGVVGVRQSPVRPHSDSFGGTLAA